jgi:hypothetical protein
LGLVVLVAHGLVLPSLLRQTTKRLEHTEARVPLVESSNGRAHHMGLPKEVEV